MSRTVLLMRASFSFLDLSRTVFSFCEIMVG
jgi:hypothetical protein